MRKTLAVSTALSTALLLPTSYAAAAEAPTVTLSGSVEYQYVFFDNDQRGNGGATGRGHSVSMRSDESELVWDASGVTDNGLEYGANIQMRYGENNGTIDEAYVSFAGTWGMVEFGATDDVIDNTAVGGQDAQAHGGGFDGNFGEFYVQRGDAAVLGTSSSTGDANKIAYYTPEFSGLSGAVSFTPSAGDSFRNAGTDNGDVNVLETALQYGGSLDAVDVALSAGYRHGDASGTNGTEVEDINQWRVGATVGFAGFTVGAGYGDSGDANCTEGTQCDAGDNYNFGIGYDYGRGVIGFGYAYGEVTNNNGSEDSFEVFNIGADYLVSEGLTTYAEVVWADSDDGTNTTQAGSNEGTIFIIGTNVSF